MATKTSMIITATDYVTEHDQQKTITDINPQANDAHLRTWAQETIAMTKDTYKGSKRIDVTDLDNLTPRLITNIGYNKQIGGSATYWFSNFDNPTISIPVANFPITNNKAEALITIVTPLDVAPIVEDLAFTGEGTFQFIDMIYGSTAAPVYEQGRWRIFIRADAAPEVGTLTFKVSFAKSAQYSAHTIPFTINITEE